MHHHLKNQERALNLSILISSGPVKLSRRLHAWWCPSVNFFKFQPCDHTPPEPKNFDSRKVPSESEKEHRPIPSRHSLRLRLRRYLIVFDPLTFVH
ncbi:hypothetical protein EJ07DRAFT_148373 [Lizonia empirigonia]|nr:hypothetical protein EJ07DRAFT_148373 [Lizonia empirigonia]